MKNVETVIAKSAFLFRQSAKKVVKIYSPTPFESATKALKLEEDFSSGGCMSAMSMYPSDKMKMSAPGCFTGRYSPTSYRGPDQMRRCMTNPSNIDFFYHVLSLFKAPAGTLMLKHRND
ncbi:CLUMA_CG008300, isoform A [Clunio marinus]|uniref:CLUMA_CG008300, isoform A n=1 Tax=Clunio marinus TaxID=568069 RepID=A0A1J1I781_9DIPT|nr:CLUMA_CG008300, isoform A [Clunio marinus]